MARPAAGMGLVFAEEADMAAAAQVAEVLVQVVGRDKPLDNLAAVLVLVAVLEPELSRPSILSLG